MLAPICIVESFAGSIVVVTRGPSVQLNPSVSCSPSASVAGSQITVVFSDVSFGMTLIPEKLRFSASHEVMGKNKGVTKNFRAACLPVPEKRSNMIACVASPPST